MKFFDDDLVKNLPDAYRKDSESNNYKILQIEKHSMDEFRKTLNEIYESLDLNKATGQTLDLYGEMVGQPRGKSSDEQYVLLIKVKLMQNISNGTHASILKSLAMTFNCEPSQIQIVESETPCVVKAITLPLDVIVASDISTSEANKIITKLLPAGIRLESYLFEGTFEFSNSENEQDNEKGFCDVEGGTIGGYLGVTQGDESDIILPI